MPWIAALLGAGGTTVLTGPIRVLFINPLVVPGGDWWLAGIVTAIATVLHLATGFAIGWWLANRRLAVWAIRGHLALFLLPKLIIQVKIFNDSLADISTVSPQLAAEQDEPLWQTVLLPTLMMSAGFALMSALLCGLIYAGSWWRTRPTVSTAQSSGEVE